MKQWLWIGIGIGCLVFLEHAVFSQADVSDGVKWFIYGLIGLGALGKAAS